MAYTFDHEHQIYEMFRYKASTGVWTAVPGNSTAFDYFPDDAEVGDCFYFSQYFSRYVGRPCQFHDIKLFVGTQLVADSITLAWEYYQDGVGWTEIPALTDNSNSFQNAGQNWVTFPIPAKMFDGGNYYYYLNGKKYQWVRARITALTNLTEGGAQSTQVVTAKDHTIKIEGEAAVTLTSIYNADQAGAWGQVERFSSSSYLVKCPLFFYNSHFTSTRELFQLGREDYPVLFMAYETYSFTFGALVQGYGADGSALYHHTKQNYPYNYFYRTIDFYGSIYIRPQGSYGDPAFAGAIDIIDSVLVTDGLFYWCGSAARKIYRTVVDQPYYLYIYANIDIDGLKMTDSPGILSYGPSITISNVDFGADKQLLKNAAAIVNLINCIGPTNANIILLQYAEKRPVKRNFTIDLTVLDENNTPIPQATVVLQDTDGGEVFNVLTNAEGKITQQTVMAYEKWNITGEGYHEKDYNPFTLTISKPGTDYLTYQTKFTLATKVNWTISLMTIPTVIQETPVDINRLATLERSIRQEVLA